MQALQALHLEFMHLHVHPFEKVAGCTQRPNSSRIADGAPQSLVGPGTGGRKWAFSFAKAISIGFKSGE
jgi:hypothetical protein